jgi:hypothetical protein
MDVAHIPAVLPPAITVSRELVQFSLADDLDSYGDSGPAAFAWRWALTGQGPTPVSRREWEHGPPDRDTMLDESRWPYGDGWDGRATGAEVERARFLLWWLAARPDEEVPARFRRHQTSPAARHRPADATLAEGYGSGWREPFG